MASLVEKVYKIQLLKQLLTLSASNYPINGLANVR